MKKFVTVLCLLMSLVLMFGVTACSVPKTSGENANTAILSEETLSVDARSVDTNSIPKLRPYRDYNTNYMVFRNFEQWGPDFQTIRIGDEFGKISRHSGYGYGASQENFVAFGDYSMKVQPLDNPMLYFPLYSKLFSYDYTDLSNVEYITMWVYNDTDEYQTIEVGLLTTIVDAINADIAVGETTRLDPRAWTKVNYYLELNYLSISANVTDTPGLFIKFGTEGLNLRYLRNAPTLYIDEIVFNYRNSPATIPDLLKLDKGEILSFDKLYQRYVCTAAPCKIMCTSQFSVVRAADYGLDATSGEYVLRVINPPGEKTNDTWPGIIIPENIMRATEMQGVSKDDLARYYVEFDIYNANTVTVRAYPEFFSKGGANWKAWGIDTKPKQWNTFSLSFEEITFQRTGNPGPMKIRFGEFIGNEDREFFIDSVRIVRK